MTVKISVVTVLLNAARGLLFPGIFPEPWRFTRSLWKHQFTFYLSFHIESLLLYTHMCLTDTRLPSLFADFIFANLPTCWNLSVTLKPILVVLSWSLADMNRTVKIYVTWCPHSRQRSNQQAISLFPCFSSPNCPLSHLFSVTFSSLCFLLVT